MKATRQDLDLNTTVSSQQLEHQLDTCDPLACVLFSQSPSVQVYFALRSRLESSSESWLQEFVDLDGLDNLLDALVYMTSPNFNGFSDAILQIDCLSCIKAVINAKVGMEALINSSAGITKLLKGVNLANTLPRKLVFEILSVVCVYESKGYNKLLCAMEKHRKENHLLHKYSFVVNELKLAETVPHKTSLLTFINAILCSTQDKAQRIRNRSQFVGLGLLDVVSFLQKEDSDEDLYVQLQLFQEKKHEDEVSLASEMNVDLNCPQDLVDLIQPQVFGGSKMVCFVNILQDLLAIETTKKDKSNFIWQVLEQQVHHVVHAVEDVESLYVCDPLHTCATLTDAIEKDAKTYQAFYTKHVSAILPLPRNVSSRTLPREGSAPNIKKRVSCADSGFIGCDEKLSPQAEKRMKNTETPESDLKVQTSEFILSCKNAISQVNRNVVCITKNSPIVSNISENMNNGDLCTKQGRKHLSVYDNLSPQKRLNEVKSSPSNSSTTKVDCLNNLNLNSKEIEADECASHDKIQLNVVGNSERKSESIGEEEKDKTLTKDTSKSSDTSMVVCPSSVMRNLKWIKINESLRDEFPHCVWLKHNVRNWKDHLDFVEIEGLFKERYNWQMAETPLLSTSTRLRLNLFLNRCDEDPTELVKHLVRVDGPAFPLAFIKQLVDILPEHDEVKHLKFYNGNLLELGQAEQFVLHLSDVPDYRILLKGQLMRSELCATAARLRGILTSMLESSRIILSNKGLAEVLLLVLKLGNFLNHGQFNGYAGGYKLSSLSRLVDVMSQEAGQSLLHFIIKTVQGKDSNTLSFLNEIPRLQRAASCSLADIKADFDKMNSRINAFVKQLATANPIISNGFNGFLDEVNWKFRELQSHITELKMQSRKLAEYFCESESFDLEACFKHLLDFFEELKTYKEEAKLMEKQKSIASMQTKMFCQQINCRESTHRFGIGAVASSSVMETKRQQLVDCVLAELHRANFTPTTTRPSSDVVNAAAANPEWGHIESAPVLLLPGTSSDTRPQSEMPKTPDRENKHMELSRISLVGTPMMNRPCSHMYDEELTMHDNKPKFATSSENDLLDGKLVSSKIKPKIPLVLSMPDRWTPNLVKSHHRSRSDLADSNIHTKWIRYYDQLKQVQAPIAKPESSITLATLNLEGRGVQRYVSRQNEVAIDLVQGPTVKMPPPSSTDFIGRDGFVEPGGKKVERRSALTNFLSKISRRVLKPRNSPDVGVDNIGFGEGGGGGVKMDSGKRPPKLEKHSSKSSSLGKISGSEVVVHGMESQHDKENVGQGQIGGPFDRQKKNPIRLSNRFKSKINK